MLWWSQTLKRCMRRLIWRFWIGSCVWLLITTLLITWQQRTTLSLITRLVSSEDSLLRQSHYITNDYTRILTIPCLDSFPINSTGHESHKLLWHHPWSSVRVIHRAVLWIGDGSFGVGSAESQWDGRASTDAKWLLDFPRCTDRVTASHQIVFKIHWQSAHFLQVVVHNVLDCRSQGLILKRHCSTP